MHCDIGQVNAQAPSDTHGKIVEDLLRSGSVVGNEAIVQSVVESDLNQSRVTGLR